MESLHSAARRFATEGIIVDAYRQGRSLDERGEGGETPLHAALHLARGLQPSNAYLLLSLGLSSSAEDRRHSLVFRCRRAMHRLRNGSGRGSKGHVGDNIKRGNV